MKLIGTGKNRIVFAVIVLLELIVMLVIYPGGLIRRETMYSSGGNHAYSNASPMQAGDECMQSFKALGDVLLEHGFAVRIEDELSDDFVILYELTSPEGDVLASEEITATQLYDGGYRRISLDLRLKKGREYSYTLKVLSGSGSVSMTCTPYPEDFTQGTVLFSQNGTELPMQSFNEFLYDQKLNLNNVIFTWLFLWIIGAVAWGLYKKSESIRKFDVKTKIQWLVLAAEILLCIIVFSRLTGGMGVDYDEAFSWDLAANHSLSGLLAATAGDVHPPLYYMIVKAAFSLFGASLRVMVWTSIVPVILGMILSLVFIRKRWGFLSAFFFNIVYGFAPFLLHFNLNLRMYSWMNFFVLGVVLICYEIRCESKNWHFIALFLFSIAAVYTQYFAVLPIIVCYVWLFVSLLRKKERKSVVGFVIVGALDVLSYIPWLLYGMGNMGIGAEEVVGEYGVFLKPSVIFGELFASNLENSDVMAMVLSVIALVLFFLFRKHYSSEEKSFIIMLLANIVFCWYFSQWLGSLNGHFFHPRYVIFCLVFVWFLFSIVFSRCNGAVYVLFSLWAIELCLSSFRVEKAYEYETTPLMPATMEFIDANVEPDAVIVYDYDPAFDIIYKYYLPGHEFVHFDDLDLDEMRGQTFWVINLGNASFTKEQIEEYSIEVEHNPGMGFMGMERFDLWKVKEGL